MAEDCEELKNQERARLRAALEAHGATLPCPRCGAMEFDVVSEINGYRPSFLPLVLTFCKQCGFESRYSSHTLGLVDEFREQEKSRPPSRTWGWWQGHATFPVLEGN